MNITELCQVSTESARKIAHAQNVHEALGADLLLIVSGIVAAYECLIDDNDPRDIWYGQGKPEGFVSEIANVFIRLGSLCGKARVEDLVESMIKEKLGLPR